MSGHHRFDIPLCERNALRTAEDLQQHRDPFVRGHAGVRRRHPQAAGRARRWPRPRERPRDHPERAVPRHGRFDRVGSPRNEEQQKACPLRASMGGYAASQFLFYAPENALASPVARAFLRRRQQIAQASHAINASMSIGFARSGAQPIAISSATRPSIRPVDFRLLGFLLPASSTTMVVLATHIDKTG
jgi:hypothetical protein